MQDVFSCLMDMLLQREIPSNAMRRVLRSGCGLGSLEMYSLALVRVGLLCLERKRFDSSVSDCTPYSS